MDKSLPPDRRADMVLEQMTLDEKLSLVHGAGSFQAAGAVSNGGAGVIAGIPRLGLPPIQLADSAVGVRAAAERGRYATLLPSAIAEAATWDLKLAYEYGAVIGRELRDQQYNSTLGGGVYLMREPRNGRNFEYQGEDPILAGKMVAQLIKGLQDQKVIGDIKHYAFNDQETGRSIGNVKLDKRAMRETDLLAFEIAVTEGQPGMVMCSYNKVNGDWACENSYLLNDVLKKAWGFKGFVLSDWGGTHTTAKAALAGLDNEEPGGDPARIHFGDALKKAVESGEVPMARLDDMVHRIVRTEFASGIVDDPPLGRVVDPFKGAETAQTIAEQASVLLKNAGNQLPLNAALVKSIAVIGSHADTGVLSGGGSAQVDPPGGGASRYRRPRGVVPVLAPQGHPRQGAQGQSGVQRGNRYRRGGCPGQGLGDRHRGGERAHQRGARHAQPDALRQTGRTGERRGRGESAHHRGARNRRSGRHAVDWQRQRRHRDLVSGHPRSGSPGQHPVWRCQPMRQTARHVCQNRRRPAPSGDLRNASSGQPRRSRAGRRRRTSGRRSAGRGRGR